MSDESKQPDKNPNRYSVSSMFTPMGAIRRSTQAIVGMKNAFSSMHEQSLKRAKSKEGGYPEGDIRNIANSKARFEAMYELHEWNEEDLKQQIKAVRNTKYTALFMAIFSFFGSIFLMFYLPRWMVFFAVVIGGGGAILGFVKAVEMTLNQLQLEERDFLKISDLLARDDFFQKIFR
jgi:hypothetical protein